MSQTSIYFDKNTLKLLDDFAEQKGISRSDAVRFCVNTTIKPVRNAI